MPNFRTKITPSDFPFALRHEQPILALGSCFAENIGERLRRLQFPIQLNPFGILYHPMSILDNLKRLQNDVPFSEKDLWEHQGLWHSFAHHSVFSKMDKMETLAGIQQRFEAAKTVLKQTNRLILTFGTAHVFEYLKTGQVVANCHKLPGKDFQKRRMSVVEITESWLPFLQELKLQNTDLQVIMTISPVRHIRDGLLDNQKSKATLQLAVAEICERLDYVHYFPAYEIMMDDLRDYRFYEADMIHPNQVAIDYIWEHFQTAFFDKNTQLLNQKIAKITAATQHRPFHVASAAHQQFLKQQLENIEKLQEDYPFLTLKSLRDILQQQKK